MSWNQASTALSACEEVELAAVQGAGRAEEPDAKTGLEVPHAAALKFKAGIGVAQGPETQIA